MKYLKYFKTEANWTAYKDGSDYILPNVSYIEENKGVSYEPLKAFKLQAKYNATSDNLLAFTNATNLKSLKVNGNSIEFEPAKNLINNFDVLGENILLDMEAGTASFPESYLIKPPVSSWSFKAKDPNYVINENTCVCMLGMMDGMTLAQPMSLAEAMSYALTTNDGVTLELVDAFLAEMNMQIESGAQIGFTLMDVDMNSETFAFIDTEHQTNVTTGGLPTYSFDSEGLYDVEIELADPVISMQFAETSLSSIEISSGITSIGSAFQYCYELTGELVIPDSVTYIGYGAFRGCSGLTSIIIGSGVTSIGESAFEDCTSLTSVIIPNSVTSINDYAFIRCSGLTSIVIGSGVTSIGTNAFSGCTSLTSVYISDIAAWCNISFSGYANISSNPLSNRCNLYLNNELVTDLTIPDSITTINDYAFSGCESLTSVNIPDSVITINDWAFYGCNITSVTIGAGVTSIGKNTFGYCKDLGSITCYAPTAPSIQYTTFQAVRYLYGVSGTLYVPSESDYSSWMSRDSYYLGSYNWKLQYI